MNGGVGIPRRGDVWNSQQLEKELHLFYLEKSMDFFGVFSVPGIRPVRFAYAHSQHEIQQNITE